MSDKNPSGEAAPNSKPKVTVTKPGDDGAKNQGGTTATAPNIPEGLQALWDSFDEDERAVIIFDGKLAAAGKRIYAYACSEMEKAGAEHEGGTIIVAEDGQMFDPSTFPEGVRGAIPIAATITKTEEGRLDIAFGVRSRARLIRLAIVGFEGVAPTVNSVRLTNREGHTLLPVQQDFMALRQNKQLEVLPGDQIVVRYEDERPATPRHNRHEQRLNVAFNTARITASFLNYRIDALGRHPTHRPPLKSPIRVSALSSVVEALGGRSRHASRARELRKSLCSARVRRKSVTRTGELD